MPLDIVKEYENTPYFELVDIAEKERDLEKRKALFELSNKILKRDFMKIVKQNELKSGPSGISVSET